MSNSGNSPGINRLTRAIKKVTGAGLPVAEQLDFGVIQSNGSLLTNDFPVPIPKEEYHIGRLLRSMSIYCETEEKYKTTNRPLKKGDRVLVAWVGSEAVVIDVIIKASVVF